MLRAGIPIEAEQQILIPAGIYHRDPRIFGDLADTFSPDAAGGAEFPKVYFFSDHGPRLRGPVAGDVRAQGDAGAVARRLALRARRASDPTRSDRVPI